MSVTKNKHFDYYTVTGYPYPAEDGSGNDSWAFDGEDDTDLEYIDWCISVWREWREFVASGGVE